MLGRRGLFEKNSPMRDVAWGVDVLAWRADVWIEFAFGRLGVTNAHASWLAQIGRSVLIVGRWRSREKRSIARVQGQSAASIELLQTKHI